MRIVITERTHILFLVLIIVIVFSGSLKNDFAWDDKFLVINNPYIKSWNYIPKIFTTQLYEGSDIESNFYRPLQLLSFMIDYSFWKLNAFGYHLSSLFFHIVNTALVYLILIAISFSPNAAFLAAVFFAIAPVISSTTFYISARSDLLMALFLFSSFFLFNQYTKYNNKILQIISVFSFILSLLSKEMAIILPLLLMLELWRVKKKIAKLLNALLPYFIVLAFYIVTRSTILNFSEGTNKIIDFSFPATIPLWRRVITDFVIIPQYLKLVLFPHGLHMERFITPAATILQVNVIASLFIVSLLVFIIKKMSQRYSMAQFAALWFLFGLLPVLNIYPISVFFGEGWLYVPSVGFFIILSIVLIYIIWPRIGKPANAVIIIALVIYYSLVTISHGMVWKDSVSLFNNILKYEQKSPFIYLTHNNLGMAYYDKGEFERSIEHYKNSILLNPKYPEPYNNLGIAYIAIGRPIKAITCFKKAIGLNKNYISAYSNLAHAYSNIGLKDSAIRFSMAAINKDPNSYKAYCNLGYIFSEKHELDKAIDFFKKACEVRNEYYEPHYCLGSLYIKKNRFGEALDEYKTALQLGLGDYKFYNELAFLYLKNNKFKEARDALKRSIELNRNQSEPHNNLGNLYSMFRYFVLAIEEYQKALEIDPDNEGIRNNLEKTKAEQNNTT